MNASYTIPTSSHDNVAAYVRGRVVALRTALAAPPSPQPEAARYREPLQVVTRSEPSPADEQRLTVRYQLAVRTGSLVGANISVSVLPMTPEDEATEGQAPASSPSEAGVAAQAEAEAQAEAQAQARSAASESATQAGHDYRILVAARPGSRLTDRIDRMIVNLGCLMLVVFVVLATVVAMVPGALVSADTQAMAVKQAWDRFFEWLAAVVLSYAILLAGIGPLPKRLLRLFGRNRRLLERIQLEADRIFRDEAQQPAASESGTAAADEASSKQEPASGSEPTKGDA